jgi:hypothetical protein
MHAGIGSLLVDRQGSLRTGQVGSDHLDRLTFKKRLPIFYHRRLPIAEIDIDVEITFAYDNGDEAVLKAKPGTSSTACSRLSLGLGSGQSRATPDFNLARGRATFTPRTYGLGGVAEHKLCGEEDSLLRGGCERPPRSLTHSAEQ